MTRRPLARFLRPYRQPLTVALLLTLTDTLVDLARPWPLKLIVDNAIGGHRLGGSLEPLDSLSRNALTMVAIGIGIGLVALSALLAYLNTFLTSATAERVGADLRQELFGHLVGLSLGFHDRNRSGELVSRLTDDVERVQDAVVASFTTLVPEVLTLVGMVVILLLVDVPLGLAALSVAPVLAVVVVLRRRRIRVVQRHARDAEGNLAAHATDVLRNVRAVQAFTREPEAARNFASRNINVTRASIRAMDLEARYSPLADIVLAVGTGLVLWVGVERVTNGHITIGILLVVLSYLSSVYGPIRSLSRLARTLARAAASRDRLGEILSAPERVTEDTVAIAAPSGARTFRMRGVSFAYAADAPVLADVTFDVDAESTVCVVGATGAGKSTLLSLILRFYEPSQGCVELGGIDIRRLTLASLRGCIGMVPQDAWMFDASIRENIAFGYADATDAEVLAAARLALVDEFATRLPDGYDTRIGEGGVLISGGQRRRVALARALIRNAPILLLDEPTSGLDAVSERSVVRALDQAKHGRTVLIVTHRLNLALDADQVVVLDHGRVIEHGEPQRLLRSSGPFARLCEHQTFHPSRGVVPAGNGSSP